MNEKLDKYLCNKYPEIFAERKLSAQQSCMHWGFSHDDGWFFLLNTLCRTIQSRIKHPGMVPTKSLSNFIKWPIVKVCRKMGWWKYSPQLTYVPAKIKQVVALQVKEKFGGLRFYYEGGDANIAGMIALAENLSYHICERCGVMNELVNANSDGWIKSTCSKCSSNVKDHATHADNELISLWTDVRLEKLQEANKGKCSDNI